MYNTPNFPNGFYYIYYPISGTYTLTATKFGYYPAYAYGVTLLSGTVTTRNLTIVQKPTFYINGLISFRGRPVEGALLTILGTRIETTTDAVGYYSVTLPIGSYTMQIVQSDKQCANYALQMGLVVSANQTRNVALPSRNDQYGYVCENQTSYPSAAATQVVTGFLMSGSNPPLDDGVADVHLPFDFSFYGVTYTAGSQLLVSTNGNLYFGREIHVNDQYPDSYIPSGSAPNNAIYGVWQNFDLERGGAIYTDVVGTSPSRRLVVDFRDLRLANIAGEASFQIWLEEGSNKVFINYAALELPEYSYAISGIENPAGTDGLPYSNSGYALQVPPSGSSTVYTPLLTGDLSGRVQATGGVGINSAAITVVGPSWGSTTSAAGDFSLGNLLAGSYTMTVTASGYLPSSQLLTITAGQVTTVAVTLAPDTSPSPTPFPLPCYVSFTDVDTTHLFYDSIMYLACRNVVSGLPNGDGTFRFNPNGSTTRGEFAKIAKRGFGLPDYTPTTPTFADVPTSNVFYPFIEAAARAGVVSGAACGAALCYRPSDPIRRGEVAVIIRRARNYPTLTPSVPTFADVPANHFAYGAVEALYSRGIISGAECNSGGGLCYRPNDNIRRGELSRIVRRAVEQ